MASKEERLPRTRRSSHPERSISTPRMVTLLQPCAVKDSSLWSGLSASVRSRTESLTQVSMPRRISRTLRHCLRRKTSCRSEHLLARLSEVRSSRGVVRSLI